MYVYEYFISVSITYIIINNHMTKRVTANISQSHILHNQVL